MVLPGNRARALLAGALVLGAAMLCPRGAAAQDRILVWSIQASGSTEGPVLREQLYTSIAGGCAAAGLPVVPRAEIARRLAGAPGLVGCETATCLTRVAELLGVRRIIRAQVEIFGSSYVYRLEQLGADGRVRNRGEGRCDVCTVVEVNEQVSQLAVRLARSPATPPAAVPVPAGAARPPTAVPAAATPPPPDAAGPPPRDTRRRSLSPWRWTALGISVVALVVGASLVAVDGRGSCSAARPGAACPRLYDTGTAGWTLTTIGLVGLGGTGAWFWLDRPRARVDGRRAMAGGLGLRLKF